MFCIQTPYSAYFSELAGGPTPFVDRASLEPVTWAGSAAGLSPVLVGTAVFMAIYPG
jgi:hypothetical protein